MKNASRKIPWIYSGITISYVVITGIVFYLFASRYTQDLYYEYLTEKAHLIAVETFEQDEMDPVRYQNVVRRRHRSIPTSAELFVDLSDTLRARTQMARYLSNEQIDLLHQDKRINFTTSDGVGSAIIYYDNSGTYAVIVLSRNPYGNEIAKTIAWATLLLVVLASVVLYLISRLYAIRIVDRINNDYQTEKLFVNNASHEINNPLTAIQGECEIALLKERTQDEYRNSLERIQQETARIINIMNQLLNFSRTRSEEIDSDSLDEVSIADLLQQFCDERTEVEVTEDFTIHIREDLLLIALRNIIGNARKYSCGKPVTVKAGHHKLTIADHGIGIPKEALSHVFEPFYRAGNTGNIDGHGIGLPLAKAILEKFNAHLSVHSKQGQGTTFCITFR